MENLDKSWQKLSESLEQDGHLGKAEILVDLRAASEQPLMKLKNGVKYKLWFSYFFAAGFIALIFFLQPIPVKVFMGIVAISYLVVAYFIAKGVARLEKGIDFNQPTVQVIVQTLETVKIVLKQEVIFYIVTFPFSLSGGFLAGISAESGSIDLFLENKWTWLVLAACHLVFFPVGYWISDKLNDKAFGKYIRQLEGLIEQSKA